MIRPALGAIVFAGQNWLWLTAGAFALALALVALSYLRTPAPRWLRATCAALKLLGVAALLACLLEPLWTEQRAKPGENVIAIVADNSASMNLRGSDGGATRGEALQQVLLGDQSAWRAQLGSTFLGRSYLADSRLTATTNFSELQFTGQTSTLGATLKDLAERHRGQPLAGVILLTDGVASDAAELEQPGLPPIYPVLFGSDQPPRDLGIVNTAVTQTSFEDAPVTVQAEISASGFAGEEITGRLVALDPSAPAAAGKLVDEQTLSAPDKSDKLIFRFQVRPAASGVLFYELQVSAPEGVAEATTVNNRSVIVIDRGTGPHRVLYLAGRPNWEYKFLRRAVQEDNETQLVGLIRIARREGKFEFRGRTGESSNPLFRGFDNQSPEEVERYDQPVLVRLETEETNELIGGFPKTAEELFRYRAVIIDDLEAEFFTADQMTLLQRFVSERGGSVLMLGGADSLAEGKYARTPIGEMLPVYLDKSTTPGDGHPLRLSLTREGWLQPWARLRRNEPEEQARLGDLPPFEVLNHTGGVKPAAIVVATVNDGRNDYPALVTQRFGRGRTAALLIGDLWQSGLGHEARQADLGKAWRQLVRWLVADVPERLELQAEPEAGGTLMRLKVRARDTKYRPMENASVVLTVQAPGAAEPIMLEAEASAREPGVFETSYVPRNSGGYRVTAEVKDENGAVVGSARTGWATDLAAAEFRTLIPNRALMENLARGTGGEVIAPDKLGDLVQRLPGKAAPITETLTRPLWHTPWMFFFALGCLITEWGLRRWKGLP